MTDITEAIAARMAKQEEAARAKRDEFTPDPELERLAERMDLMRETSPRQYADANFGDLRQRVESYRARKANHERKP